MKGFMVLSFVILALIAFSSVDGLRWRVATEDTVRSLVIGSSIPNRFEVRAVKRERGRRGDVDAIQFVFSTNWVPRFVFRYFSRDSDSADLIAARWMLWKIIEYNETATNDSGFNPGVDPIVSEYHLWLRSFDNMTRSEDTNSDGAKIYKVCTNLNSPTPRPNVQLCATLADRETRVSDDTEASSNRIKWSLGINSYPYQSSSSRLAIKVSFDSRQIVRDFDPASADVEKSPNEGSMELADVNGNKAVAAWIQSVSITGEGCAASAPVVRSVINEGQFAGDVDVNFPASNDTDNLSISLQYRVAYFSFVSNCQPESIQWDPEFGVFPKSSDVSFFLPSFVMVFILLFAFLM